MQIRTSADPGHFQRIAEPYLAPVFSSPAAQEPQLRHFSPLTTLPPALFLEKEKAWVLTRYADVKALLSDRRFKDQPPHRLPKDAPRELYPLLCARGLSASELRETNGQLLDESLFAEKIKAASQIAAEQKLRNIAIHKHLGSAFQYAHGVSNRTFAELFGIPEKQLSVFIQFTRSYIDIKHRSHLLSHEERFHIYEHLDIGLQLIKTTMKTPGTVHALGLRQQDRFIDLLASTLLGGLDLSIQLIAGAIHLCARYATEKQKLLEDNLWDNLPREVYRYYSPINAPVHRIAIEDCALNEHHFKKGEIIYPLMAAANRDKTVFENPGKFEISRKTGDVLFYIDEHHSLGHHAALSIAGIAAKSYLALHAHNVKQA